MTTGRAVAYIGGGTVLLAWLASAAGVPRDDRQPRAPQPRPAEVALDAIAADVQTQATRLRARLAVAPAPQAPLRNPFSFDTPRPPVRSRQAVPIEQPAPAAVPEAPPEPVLTLLGLAERKTPDGLVRTAVIGDTREELYLVTVGEEVVGRYRVAAISPDVVELRDLVTGAVRRLTLQ
jgi:hypothetical protein